MGVNILVESVVCPRSRYPAQTLFQRQSGWGEVKAICEAMRWDEVPWEDPSEQHGTRTSAAYSQYSLLLQIGQSLDTRPQGHYQRFPHLLERDPNTTIYVPMNLTYPLRLKCKHDGRLSKTLVVGSSLRLMSELEDLEYFLEERVEEFGKRAKVTGYGNFAGNAWGDIHQLCVVLMAAANESQQLNLPFCIRY